MILRAAKTVYMNQLLITLTNAGKRFNRDWIFRRMNYVFETGRSYAITGPNGSGKSTLLQAIAASLMLNEGTVDYRRHESDQTIDPENIYQYISLAAPYLDLIEEMTASELLKFHHHFKPLTLASSVNEILASVELEGAADKQIRYFSSGMKQRLKLAQAFFSDTPVLLLDEPCTNLDVSGYRLYHRLVERYAKNKLVIVSSNDAEEMSFCEEKIAITDFK